MTHLCNLLLTLTVPEGVPGSISPNTCPGHISPENVFMTFEIFWRYFVVALFTRQLSTFFPGIFITVTHPSSDSHKTFNYSSKNKIKLK